MQSSLCKINKSFSPFKQKKNEKVQTSKDQQNKLLKRIDKTWQI